MSTCASISTLTETTPVSKPVKSLAHEALSTAIEDFAAFERRQSLQRTDQPPAAILAVLNQSNPNGSVQAAPDQLGQKQAGFSEYLTRLRREKGFSISRKVAVGGAAVVIDDTSKRKRLLIFVEKNAPPVPEGFQPLYPWYGEKLPLHFVPIPKEANSESKEFRQAIVGRRVGQEFMVATPGSGSTLLTYEVLDVA